MVREVYAIGFLISFLFSVNYILKKILWIEESKLYLLELLDYYTEKESSNLYSEFRRQESLKGKTFSESREAVLKRLKLLFYIELYRNLKIKSSISILINPFSSDITDMVKNKRLLNSILEG